MKKLPIIVLTGFLGSGKTTLLSNALKQNLLQDAFVIINEFGKVGLDHKLLDNIEEKTTLIKQGCMCCQKKEELILFLKKLFNNYEQNKMNIKSIVIETTGLADPASIMFSILSDPFLSHHFEFERIVTCIDSLNYLIHLKHPENISQICSSDIIFINKLDLLKNEKEISDIKQKIFSLNPLAKIFERIEDISLVFKIPIKQTQKSIQPISHLSDINSIAICFNKPLNWNAFTIWMSMLLHLWGEKIMRIKGIIDTGEKFPIALNGVCHIIHPPQHLKKYKNDKIRNSELVFITKEISPQAILSSLKAFENLLQSNAIIKEL